MLCGLHERRNAVFLRDENDAIPHKIQFVLISHLQHECQTEYIYLPHLNMPVENLGVSECTISSAIELKSFHSSSLPHVDTSTQDLVNNE
jgi:hypothetical protein